MNGNGGPMTPQVLVTDDEAALRTLIAENLLDRNIGVIEAGDGVEALEVLEKELGDMLARP